MKLVARVKLQPTAEQADLLYKTLLAWVDAVNYVSEQAWERKCFRAFDLHHATYYDIRDRFGLASRLAVLAIGVVADSYRAHKATKHVFRKPKSMVYDKRLLSWQLDKGVVKIWTFGGRQRIPFVCGEHQRDLLNHLQGECDLVYRNGEFYLHQVCDVSEGEPISPSDWLGVDMGIVNLATTSDGERFTGDVVLGVRERRRRQRRRLQSKGTRSARRKLRRLSGKERRFATDVNHQISKQIVERAKRTGRGIAIEDLHGIRERARLHRLQRVNLHSWSFSQLRTFLEYKSRLAGIPLVVLNPKYSSQTCSACGCVDSRNRKNQHTFHCVVCGYAANADHNAAINLGRWALTGAPDASASIEARCELAD